MKNVIKRIIKFPPVYNLIAAVSGIRQNLKILSEENKYNIIAARKNSKPYSYDTAFKNLATTLAERGITWPPNPSSRPLHILYASVPGNWEMHNIPPQLEKIGKVSCYFTKERGIPIKNRAVARPLIDSDFTEFVKALHDREPVDMLLSYFSGAEISPSTIENIKSLGIAAFSFHWDDRPSFFGRRINGQWSGPAAVCRHYDLNLTNSPESLVKYRIEGALATFWPEAANPDHFKPDGKEPSFDYDVSFVGAKYGVREKFIKYLRKNGIKVAAFGPGWENGSLSEKEMVVLYNKSRINLGFGYILFSDQVCLKGRDFEVPASGAVYLTTYNKHLEYLYKINKEIITYRTKEECLEKINYLLSEPELCREIRRQARQAVLEKHTWVKRVNQLLYGYGSVENV